MAGLFFCLAPAEGAGLLFCPAAIQPHTIVYSAFYTVNAIIPPTIQNSARGFTWAFPAIAPLNSPRYQHDTSGYNTARATLEGIHAPGRAQPILDTTATPGRCAGQHRPHIIIRYIRGCSISQTMPARRWQRLHLYRVSPAAGGLAPGQQSTRAGRSGTFHPAGQSSSRSRGGRRGTIGGSRRSSFRAFAR